MSDIVMPSDEMMRHTSMSMSSVSWFEFLLDEHKLDNHLQQQNPDPSPCQLIIQFLQQAEAHLAASTALVREIPTTPNGQNDSRSEDGNIHDKLVVKESKKVIALKLLALKVAAHLNWNLNILLKNIPVALLQILLNELMRLTVDGDIEEIKSTVSDYNSISEETLFSLQLFHRWALLAVVRDSFPRRPIKSFVQVQGQVDPTIAYHALNEVIMRNLRESTAVSIENLEKCIQCGRVLKLPVSKCFPVLSDNTEDFSLIWDNCVTVTPQEYHCQLYYDLGTFFFYQEAYTQAYTMFKHTSDLIIQVDDPVFINVDNARLKGYHHGCQSLQGVTQQEPPEKITLYEKSEACRRNGFKGIVDVLIEDNLRQELTMIYRSELEDEIGTKGDSLNEVYVQVSICNVVRGVMEGKALVSLLADVIEDADPQTIEFLILVLGRALHGASFSQKSNLKCFVWHLMDLSAAASHFNHAIMNGDFKKHFNEQELMEMSVYIREPELSYADSFDDATLTCSSFPSSRDSSVSLSNPEQQLMYSYDPDIIRHVVSDLCTKLGRSPAYVMSLNEKWKVPREMHQVIYNLASSHEQAFIYLLVGKACHLMEVRIFERARQLLMMADRVVAELSYTLSKHIRWYTLLADLQQYNMNESLGENSTLQDLIKKTKTCITSVRLGQDIQPSHNIIQHCAAFLMNIRDIGYLSNMDQSGSGHIEFCRQVACMLKELPSVKSVRKLSREIWDTVRNIYTIGSQRISSSGRHSAIHRDPTIAIMSVEAFQTFLTKFKDPSCISVLISCFTKYYNLLRDDISCEIYSEYVQFWPTVVNNPNTLNVRAIEESLSILMQHALATNPSQPSWLRTQADIHFANNQYSPAMKFYMESGVVASDFFSIAVPKSLYDDQVYKRMIKCCLYLQCHTQVAVLCQFTDEVDYTTAFKALQERNSYDAMDSYYSCIWDISILEFLVHLHTRRGEMDKRQTAMKALSQLDLNSNNPDDIIQRALQIRKRKFLRALAKQYL
ncbi:integrator complex subunit 8-like isoform X3 [Mytilus californianus]|uniref:integrator complex subunit 8-like isoform X3 n=1 Tax=Mytilus californianus TaxID=6549 RepID=UPI0022453C45|nr:integrator complex subunit 8-like isoform X3 [Mytilus californianus]